MKRWALIIAGLYLLTLTAFTLPVVALAFFPRFTWNEAGEVYSSWPYWFWLVIMVASQFALLAVPVRIANRRPVTRGSLWPTLLAGGLMMAGLVTGAVLSVYEFVVGEQGPGNWIGWVSAAVGGMTWLIWLVVFFRMSRSANPSDLITRQCRWLFKGSILELLIAVPTHIVARSRDYCCAGFMTFMGLTMGVSVMLFAFGPAVFFLYAERWQRLQPKPLSQTTGEV